MTVYHTVYTAGDCLWTMQDGGFVRTWVVQDGGELLELTVGDYVPGGDPDAWMNHPGGNGSRAEDDTGHLPTIIRPPTPPNDPDDPE